MALIKPHEQALQDSSIDDFEIEDTGRSNFVSFLIGGAVVATGLMAFLFYDTPDTGPRGAFPPAIERLGAPSTAAPDAASQTRLAP